MPTSILSTGSGGASTRSIPRLGLAVCPTVYHGRGDGPYLSALGAATDPRIDLLWTGRAICSPEIDLADAATVARTTARPVLIWDNYPVNDVAMTAELHLGAYRGRDPHLFRFCRGVIANPMEHAESSKIALATIADYLWDPEGYDPERQLGARHPRRGWTASMRAAVRLFADNVRTSCLEEADAPLLAARPGAAGVRGGVRRTRGRPSWPRGAGRELHGGGGAAARS